LIFKRTTSPSRTGWPWHASYCTVAHWEMWRCWRPEMRRCTLGY